ncbi:hypothetical protein [Micromonospora sp. NPDC023956]|uniref:hypothetical protein n=1 Tax=Micromonospora sp. NPDC023956 TaxID=3155722 RepID=UPI0033D6F1B7
MKRMTASIDPRTLPSALRTKLGALLADHMREAPSPREGVLSAAEAAKAEALRNGWSTLVATGIGQVVVRMGEDAIGAAALAAEEARILQEARANVRRAETAYRRAVETSKEHPERITRHAARLAAARNQLRLAEAGFREATAA